MWAMKCRFAGVPNVENLLCKFPLIFHQNGFQKQTDKNKQNQTQTAKQANKTPANPLQWAFQVYRSAPGGSDFAKGVYNGEGEREKYGPVYSVRSFLLQYSFYSTFPQQVCSETQWVSAAQWDCPILNGERPPCPLLFLFWL